MIQIIQTTAAILCFLCLISVKSMNTKHSLNTHEYLSHQSHIYQWEHLSPFYVNKIYMYMFT